jgi:hypothetical protein
LYEARSALAGIEARFEKLLFAHLVPLTFEKNTHVVCLPGYCEQLLNDVLVYLEVYFQLPTP